MTSVEKLIDKLQKSKDWHRILNEVSQMSTAKIDLINQAKEMEKEQKIALLKSLVYSVCIGDDVEDVEEWLKEHELNKSE